MLGEFKVLVRLTVDLIPEVKVIVHREGETAALPQDSAPVEAEEVVAEQAAEETPEA